MNLSFNPITNAKSSRLYYCLPLLLLLFLQCQSPQPQQKDTALQQSGSSSTSKEESPRQLTQAFKDYWYAGEAEITSYQLSQARYGELREGTAALIFVTEEFLPGEQVKADQSSPENVSVLKLNATKNFVTGIYPYSMMNSTFYPLPIKKQALKVTQSVQEWCGQVYTQLNNRAGFEVKSHSYFQSEADQNFTLAKAPLENGIWTQLRVDPNELPTGTFEMIPDFGYIRLKHIPLQAYEVQASRTDSTYTLSYPTLERQLTIRYQSEFPYAIEGWEERFKSGFGSNAQFLTTTATAMKQLKTPYWQQNSNADQVLRNQLGLE